MGTHNRNTAATASSMHLMQQCGRRWRCFSVACTSSFQGIERDTFDHQTRASTGSFTKHGSPSNSAAFYQQSCQQFCLQFGCNPAPCIHCGMGEKLKLGGEAILEGIDPSSLSAWACCHWKCQLAQNELCFDFKMINVCRLATEVAEAAPPDFHTIPTLFRCF